MGPGLFTGQQGIPGCMAQVWTQVFCGGRRLPLKRLCSLLNLYPLLRPGSFSPLFIVNGCPAAEQMNRARVQYPQGQAASGEIQGQANAASQLPGWPGANAAESLVRMRIQYGAEEGQGVETGAVGAQEALEEGKCETCEKRKYQDGSDDSSVSYQTPTRIDPDLAASAVRGHEMEHVAHEQAKAQREDRKVVSQSVTLHTDICPECGETYVSGGTTRTVTKANPEEPEQQEEQAQAPEAA